MNAFVNVAPLTERLFRGLLATRSNISKRLNDKNEDQYLHKLLLLSQTGYYYPRSAAHGEHIKHHIHI